MSATKLHFRKLDPDTYEVVLGTSVAGIIYKADASTGDQCWATRYGDGTPGPWATKRIDAAWALVNS